MATKEEKSQEELAAALKLLAFTVVAGGLSFGGYKLVTASQEREAALQSQLKQARQQQTPLSSLFNGTSKPSTGTQVVGVAGQLLQAAGGLEGIIGAISGRK